MTDQPNPQLTQLLERARQGENGAMEQALDHLYGEIKSIARRRMKSYAPSHTLQPTALVNEALLRMIGRDEPWANRQHFLGVAARAMRSVLVDHARAKGATKRGGDRKREPLDSAAAWFEENQLDLIALDEAMTKLAEVDPRACRIVELRYFTGMSHKEVAEMMDLSLATVERDWSMARGWLLRELSKDES